MRSINQAVRVFGMAVVAFGLLGVANQANAQGFYRPPVGGGYPHRPHHGGGYYPGGHGGGGGYYPQHRPGSYYPRHRPHGGFLYNRPVHRVPGGVVVNRPGDGIPPVFIKN